MAGDWIKIKTNLRTDMKFMQLGVSLNLAEEETFFALYRTACWFSTHGKYGVFYNLDHLVIDDYVGIPGMSQGLLDAGWLEVKGDALMLKGFVDLTSIRKSLGAKVRAQILSAAACSICGSTEQLEVDHIIPISKGGTSNVDNLQALCRRCNIAKGNRLPKEST